MVEPQERLIFTIEEAGKLLGVSRPTAYKMAHSGQLPLIKTGNRKWAVPKSALDKMLLEAGHKQDRG